MYKPEPILEGSNDSVRYWQARCDQLQAEVEWLKSEVARLEAYIEVNADDAYDRD